MRPSFKYRVKEWMCKWFGHKNKYSHDFNGHHHYVCKRCGVLNSKCIKEKEYDK